jgi:hypothetical protein
MADKKADDKKMAPTVDQDAPGKMPEPAAPSGAEPVVEEGMAPLGQGAQVILTGAAQEAARGGTHGDVTANTEADAMAGQHPMPADDEDPKLKPKKA